MALTLANNHLAVHLHRLLAEEKGNIFFSPFSISTAMAMVFCASEGETETEMRAALGYDASGIDKDSVISEFLQLMSDFVKSTESYTLSCANSAIIQKDFAVKDGYKKILAESFKALLLEANFASEPRSAMDQINEWVREKTNSKIPKLIDSPQQLTSDTVIMLLNAVYFKGSWLQKFNKDSTYKRDFYNGGKEENAKSVDMMNMKESFKFMRSDSFQALELPYSGEEIAMLILLPEEKDGLKSLEKELTSSFVEDLLEKMSKKKVIVNLPRFCLEYSKSLISCFGKLGISRLFIPGAELQGASDCPILCVSDIIHKAVIEVNEEGSEAAAATSVTIVKRSLPRIYEFNADHPFVFVIFDSKRKHILFMGRVEEL